MDFGKDTPVVMNGSTSIERFWDQYQDESKNNLCRPRSLVNATFHVATNRGFLECVVSYPGSPTRAYIVQPSASVSVDHV